MRLTDAQLRCLKEASKTTIGLRVSYWPMGRGLEQRGLLKKTGRSSHRIYYITDAGRAAIAEYLANIAFNNSPFGDHKSTATPAITPREPS